MTCPPNIWPNTKKSNSPPWKRTFTPKKGAGLIIGGWPLVEERRVVGAIKIPYALSILAYADPNAEVTGLEAYEEELWPSVPVVHVAFQIMVGCGTAMLALVAIAGFLRLRGIDIFADRRFLWAAVAASPLGMIALEAGWVVTEVGRQPWIIRGVMRTAEAVTPMEGLAVTFSVFSLLYIVLGVVVIVMLRAHVFEVPDSRRRVDPAEPDAGRGARMNSPELYWYIMGLGLVAYVLTAGADFGGGVWDLLAAGPRRDAQRSAIEHAIAPIWEANHVWLIFVVVLMFTIFPRAFAVVGTALHIPLTPALIGIVLRGTAFTFRAYGLEPDHRRAAWGRLFAWSSAITPVFLGAALGGVSTGAIRVLDGQVTSGFFAGWTTLFAWMVGLFALALFALLAAVYLTADTTGQVQEDFRIRALISEVIAGGAAALVFWRASVDAPLLFDHLAGSAWTLPVQGATAACAAATLALVWTRRYRWARFTVAGQVMLVVVGWGLAMDGHIVLPDLRLANAGGQESVRAAVGPALLAGAVLLLPALWFLFRVFKAPARSNHPA